MPLETNNTNHPTRPLTPENQGDASPSDRHAQPSSPALDDTTLVRRTSYSRPPSRSSMRLRHGDDADSPPRSSIDVPVDFGSFGIDPHPHEIVTPTAFARRSPPSSERASIESGSSHQAVVHIRNGQLDALKKLMIDDGLRLQDISHEGAGAAWWSVQENKPEILAFLLQHDPQSLTRPTSGGETPL